MLTLSTLSSHLATITITTDFIIYLIIAAIVGLVAEFIVGWRLPFGFIGAIIAALVGVWLLTHVIDVVIPGDPTIYGVPIIKALLAACRRERRAVRPVTMGLSASFTAQAGTTERSRGRKQDTTRNGDRKIWKDAAPPLLCPG